MVWRKASSWVMNVSRRGRLGSPLVVACGGAGVQRKAARGVSFGYNLARSAATAEGSPMTHDEAFQADIRANPDDDAPRLIYADWLEEHGDEAGIFAARERAEFVRVQCELERLPEYDYRWLDLWNREAELLAAHEAAWKAGLPK